jgi:hypothetical protein
MTDELVPVSLGACLCPGTPHADGDSVYLRPKLGLHDGVYAQRKIISAMEGKADSDEVIATLMDVYCRKGVVAWTLVDEAGKSLEVTPEAIEAALLSDFSIGHLVAEMADSLYSPALIDPLRIPVVKSLPPMPTNGSTSHKIASSRKPRKR